MEAVSDDATADIRHTLGREPEPFEDRGRRRRCAVVIETDDRAFVAGIALPAKGHAGLDDDASADGWWQYRVLVLLRLGLEELPAREANDTRGDPLSFERVGGLCREVELRACCDEDEICDPPVAARGRAPRDSAVAGLARSVAGFAQEVPASADALAGELRCSHEGRQLLAGQGQGDGPAATLDRNRPSRGRLVRVARPDEPEVRNCPKRRIVLDWLVGRAILAQS